MIEPDELPEIESTQVTNISQATVQTVRAELVRMHQADAETIHAGEVDLQNGAAGSIKAEHVNANMALIGAVSAGEVTAENVGIGLVQAEKASISGYTGAVVAGNADVHHSLNGLVAGREVHVAESRTVILLARHVDGNVTTLFNTRDALVIGLVSGLFSGLMILLGRVLFRRK